MPKARSVECRCDARFTCGYCCRNAKPYHFTPGELRAAAELPLADRKLLRLKGYEVEEPGSEDVLL